MKNQKGFTIIPIIIVILILVGAGLYFWRYLSGRTIGPAFSPAPTNTLGWKTYRNDKYGFEIKIPQDWRIVTKGVKANVLFFSTNGEKQAQAKEAECLQALKKANPGVYVDSSVCAKPYIQDLTFTPYNPETPSSNRKNLTHVRIGGLVWERYQLVNPYDKTDDSIYYQLNTDKLDYVFSGENREINLQILSTFKFTNQPSTPAVYNSKDLCQAKTGKTCVFQSCDYVPSGKTYQEICGNSPTGWVSEGK